MFSVSGTGVVSVGRITQDALKGHLAEKDLLNTVCFICGPGPMIDSMESYLVNIGLAKDQIHYEKWW